jgi:CheY-like chemotaxis protein
MGFTLRPLEQQNIMNNTILVVDDDVNILALQQILFARNGYHVEAASSGQKALEILHRVIPDAIVMDVMMPGMNGIELCRQLRAMAHTRHIPIIIFSAKSDIDTTNACIEAGATCFLSKSESHVRLISEVRQITTAAVVRNGSYL